MKRKPSQEVLEQMKARAESQRLQLEKVRGVVARFDAEFWFAIVERLQVRIQSIQEQRLAIVKELGKSADPKVDQELTLKIKQSYTAEATLVDVISLPSDYEKTLPKMQKEHDALKRGIDEYRSRLEG